MNRSQRFCYMLVVLLVAVSTLSASSEIYNKKTFLSTRSVSVNLPMEYTTWHDHVYADYEGKCHRSNIQITGFFQASTNEHEIGKYFGIGNGKNSFVIGDDAAIFAHTADILNTLLIRDFGTTLAGTVSFKPEQEAWGLRFDYFQDINHPVKGLFFKARLPLAWVQRNMQLNVAGGTPTEVEGKTFSIQDFFKGAVEVTTVGSSHLQAPLTKAKIDGRRSDGGLADLDIALGYKVWFESDSHLFVNVGITIPTGNRVRGEFLFEPVYGNGRHFGLGAGIDGGLELWCNEHADVRALLAIEYRYLFEGTEARTIGLKNFPLGYYFLAAQNGQINKPVFPAANVLTRDMRIKPGSQFDALLALSFKSGHFVVDAGYNMFWKDEESGWIKNWQDDVFGIVNTQYDTAVAFNINNPAVNQTLLKLNQSEFDTRSFLTPGLFTHKLFGGLGYTCMVYDHYPVSFGVGGSYEFATTNADLENYAVWLKTCFSF